MKLSRGVLGSTVLVAGLALGQVGAAGAMRHNRLVKAVPAVNDTVKASPTLVRLWFKEAADIGLSSIKVSDAHGVQASVGAVKGTDEPVSIVAAVPEALAPGTYTVTWKTASKDGHVVRGAYTFTLRP